MWWAVPGHYDQAEDAIANYSHARLQSGGDVWPLQVVEFTVPMELAQGLAERTKLRDWIVARFGGAIQKLTCYIDGETDDGFFAKTANYLESLVIVSADAVRELKRTRRWGLFVPASVIGAVRRTLGREIHDRAPWLEYLGIEVPKGIDR